MASIYQTVHPNPADTPPADEQDETVIEFNGDDRIWRAYDSSGLCASAHSFYDLFERLGNRWN